jgi:hypothetical protein
MGDIYLELIVSNVADPERQREVSFLVDTGATRAWLPQDMAEGLGIVSAGTVPVELADGSVKEYPYGRMSCKTSAWLSTWSGTRCPGAGRCGLNEPGAIPYPI